MVRVIVCACMLAMAAGGLAQPRPPQPHVSLGQDGKLAYVAQPNGDRVPDFSTCGYMAGDVAIPDAPLVVVVAPVAGDNTARIQAAIDHAATLKTDGPRAVLLRKGRYEVQGALRITASNVVLRGSGAGEDGTVLVATGTDRRTLINIAGRDDRQVGLGVAVTDKYVPVNATRFSVSAGHGLKVGDNVTVRRPATAQWIAALGMTTLGGERHGFSWRPGSREVAWDRTVTRVEGDVINIDSPVTTALDAQYGGGSVAAYTWPGRISQVGVENLRCESAYDPANPKDEAHSWLAVSLESAQDAWVRRVAVAHFAAGAVHVLETCRRVTVEDCRSIAPVSEIGGGRRHAFFTAGTQTLFARCWSEDGRHDFAVGFCAGGPNAFVQCEAWNALEESGPLDSWASGVLYDNVHIDGNALSLWDRRYRNQGAGWAAANSVLWQCSAAVVNCFSPPTARNWAFGCWATFNGDGEWYGSNDHIAPESLYWAQLAERIGPDAMKRADLLVVTTPESSSPSPEQAAALIEASRRPTTRLSGWIDDAQKRRPISTDAAGAVNVDTVVQPPKPFALSMRKMSVANGWLVADGAVMVGGRQGVPWWRGGVRPSDIRAAPPAVTRFVPSRYGPGATDNLEQVTEDMLAGGRVALEHNHGLWYDRRRDDHERVRRMDGDAWPPFYEQPFARSGVGLAWDGMSKYDLTKYNAWYWMRLKQFADLADRKGLVLVHQQYFQHNILEAGAHWADFPWRSANNINDTGFPEPPPYAGDKRIFMAEQFYDVTHAGRRALHTAYIRKCLDSFADNANVIHLTSAEFTGPLHFVQFWLDTIAQWQKDTGRQAVIGLSATKDVQDAILSDPVRSKVVSVIDIRYWHYQADGTLYAPPGGQNLAPRQHARVLKPRAGSPQQAARAVCEYRTKFPDKAVIYSAESGEGYGWAVLAAGGSLASVPMGSDRELLAAVAKMKPVADAQEPTLSDGAKNWLIYSEGIAALPAATRTTWVDMRSGKLGSTGPAAGPAVVWMKK